MSLDTTVIAPGLTQSGDGWQFLDEPSKALLGRLGHSVVEATPLLNKLTGLFNNDEVVVQELIFHPSDVGIEGLLPDKRVTRGGDGTRSFSSASYANFHSLDDTTPWLDEDGQQITYLGGLLLLPSPGDTSASSKRYSTQNWYTLPFKVDGEVLNIRTKDGRLLLAGVEFFHRFDLLCFQQPPGTLLMENFGWVSIERARSSLRAVITGFDSPQDMTLPLSAMLRTNPTTRRIEAAVNQFLGVVTLPQSGVLRAVLPLPSVGNRYSFDWGDVLCDYLHTALIEDTYYEAGTQVGPCVRLYERGGQSAAWWRALDWTYPITMAGVSPAAGGLVLHNRPVRIEAYTSDARLCTRVYLDGTPSDLQGYWTWCALAEKNWGGITLADKYELTDGESIEVDFLACVMDMLGSRAIIADIYGPRDEALAVLRRYLPATAVFLPRFLPT